MGLSTHRVEQLRKNASRLKRSATKWTFTHHEALDIVAIAEGFDDWRDLEFRSRGAPSRAAPRVKPRAIWLEMADETGRKGFESLREVIVAAESPDGAVASQRREEAQGLLNKFLVVRSEQQHESLDAVANTGHSSYDQVSPLASPMLGHSLRDSMDLYRQLICGPSAGAGACADGASK